MKPPQTQAFLTLLFEFRMHKTIADFLLLNNRMQDIKTKQTAQKNFHRTGGLPTAARKRLNCAEL